jgi:hypothetical protein
MKKYYLLSFLLLLTSCGKNPANILDDGGVVKKDLMTGQFVGNYSNLTYITDSSHTGTVSSSGAFSCKRGEQIDFYLQTNSVAHDIHVGSAICTDLISPISLVTWGRAAYNADINTLGVSGISNDYKVALLRWLRILYLLDSDSNVSNGVSLSKSDNSLFANEFKNNPWHPDQVFGNYTASSLTNNTEFDAAITRLETVLNKHSYSDSEIEALINQKSTLLY